MGKILLVFTILNIIVLTSCKDTADPKVTDIKETTDPVVKDTKKITDPVVKDTESSTDISINNKCSGALERVKTAIVKFTYQFLKELIYTRSNSDVAAPMTAYLLVCQLVLYTEGKTQKQIMKFCGLKTVEEAECVYPILLSYDDNMPKGTDYYYSRNIVSDWRNIFTPADRQNFKYLADANGINGDFKKPEIVAKFLNKIIATETYNNVKNAIISSDIFKENPKSSKLVLASGVYFSSIFEYAFNANNIVQRDYYDLDNKVYKVPFLSENGIFNYTYSSALEAQIVLLPYVDGFYNSVLIVPEKKRSSDLIELINKIIENPMLLIDAIKSLKEERICFNAPYYAKYNVLTTNTVDILKKVGDIDSIFNPRTAQLKNSYGEPINAYLSDGSQKTVLKNDIRGKYPPPSKNEDPKKCKISFVADHSTIAMIENNGVPRIISIGKPRFDMESL